MSREHDQSKKSQLALALAQGLSIGGWARSNNVPMRTAYRWSREPAIRSAANSYRRRVIDRAVGRLARRATWAADMIAKLPKDAESAFVRLSALRAILSDMMNVSQFAMLEERMAHIQEQLRELAQPDQPDQQS
jgi:hypothetical protein